MKKATTLIFTLFICHLSYAQCFQDRHSSIADDAWISCDMTTNPNPSRALSHWIMYDFGDVYLLGQTHFWNANISGRTNEGISEAIIDYSIDGIIWSEWGSFNLNESNGSTFYEGEEGPNLNELEARYILITSIANHGGQCTGFSELKIETKGLSTSTEDLTSIGISQLSLFPNPANRNTSLKITSVNTLDASMQINDISGKMLKNERIHIRKGINKFPINTTELVSGQYVVNIKFGEYNSSINLTVVRVH